MRFKFTIAKLRASLAIKERALAEGIPDNMIGDTEKQVNELKEAIEILKQY